MPAIKSSGAFGAKDVSNGIVNPGGINAFKFNQRALNVDEKSKSLWSKGTPLLLKSSTPYDPVN